MGDTDITTYYGGSVLAIAGKDCLVIAGDKRMGNKFLTIGTNRTKIFEIHSHCFVAITGFLPDIQYLIERLRAQVSLFELTEGKQITIEEIKSLLSYILYTFRYSPKYVEVIVCGFSNKTGDPVIYSMDCIGATSTFDTFSSIGTASDNLAGMADALFVNQMDEDQLFVNGIQIFMNSIDRDAFSGWGVECYIISKTAVTRKEVKSRND